MSGGNARERLWIHKIAMMEWPHCPNWDSQITFERSYLARLKYVHHNPVKHGVIENAMNYRWCSASWFLRNASLAFVKTVEGFKTDKLDLPDDF